MHLIKLEGKQKKNRESYKYNHRNYRKRRWKENRGKCKKMQKLEGEQNKSNMRIEGNSRRKIMRTGRINRDRIVKWINQRNRWKDQNRIERKRR